MQLFQKTSQTTDFSQLHKLLYGFPKQGKTTFASHFYDESGKPPAFIMTEDGKGVLDLNANRITSWDDFKRLVREIKKQKVDFIKEHSCIVLDLVSDVDQWCTEFVCDQENVKSLADLGFGKGFSLKKTEFLPQIRTLMDIAPCTFIAHTHEKEIMWNGEKLKTQSPTLDKSSLDYINGKVDAIMWLAPPSKKGEGKLIIEPSQTCIAGSRFPQLVGSWKINPTDMNATYIELQKRFTLEENINGNL